MPMRPVMMVTINPPHCVVSTNGRPNMPPTKSTKVMTG